MLSLNEIKTGNVILYDDSPYLVLWSEHAKVGRGGAILRSKIKNLTNGVIIDKTFKGNERLESADLDRKDYQYLYTEGDNFYFMDPVTFEQITLNKENVGELKNYLAEGTKANIIFFDEKPLSLELPIKMTFEVTYTEPGIKGDTKSSTANKPATIQTGTKVLVPLFVNSGDKIVVDTRTGKYIERA
jgi:elongation factor P